MAVSSPRPHAGSLRTAVERRSHVLLVALSGQPKWLLPVASGLLLVGVVVLPPGLALVCLALLLVLVGWLAYLSWPVADGRGRAIRVASLVLLLVLGAQSVLG